MNMTRGLFALIGAMMNDDKGMMKDGTGGRNENDGNEHRIDD